MIKPYEHPIAKYSELAAQRRGRIINLTINLEKIIDGCICHYFIDIQKNETKNKELEYLVIEGLPFNAKLNLLFTILKKDFKEIYTAWPRIEKDLEKIRKNRNNMAHSYLDVTETFVGKRNKAKLERSKIVSKGNPIEYSQKRIDALASLIIQYTIS
jgi:hypothetical protein